VVYDQSNGVYFKLPSVTPNLDFTVTELL